MKNDTRGHVAVNAFFQFTTRGDDRADAASLALLPKQLAFDRLGRISKQKYHKLQFASAWYSTSPRPIVSHPFHFRNNDDCDAAAK